MYRIVLQTVSTNNKIKTGLNNYYITATLSFKKGRSKDCEFEVTIYKDFIFINYTKEYFTSQFGQNATVEGIFLKVK